MGGWGGDRLHGAQVRGEGPGSLTYLAAAGCAR